MTPRAPLLAAAALALLALAAAPAAAQCVFSATECTCARSTAGKTCVKPSSGSGSNMMCSAYECEAGYICDCDGSELCAVEPCGQTVYQSLVSGTVPGDEVPCESETRTKCVRAAASGPSPTPAGAMPPRIPTDAGWIRLVDRATIPSVPAGLKLSARSNPFSFEPADGYSVFSVGGYTYWPLSFVDNRVAMAIVVFDEAGNVVKTMEKPGARYIYQVERDYDTQEIVFVGQYLNTIRISWAELTAIP